MSRENTPKPMPDPFRALATAVVGQAIRDVKDKNLAADARAAARTWLTTPSESLRWWLAVLGRNEDHFLEAMRRTIDSSSQDRAA